MCGILGLCFDEYGASHKDILADFGGLMVHSQVRGTDASGVYIVNKDEVVSWKAPDSVSDNLEEMLLFVARNISDETVAIVGHTRAYTLGNPSNNNNNHPILDEPIIGVHNGVIRNHAELDRKYTKSAEVDSASIMALLRDKAEHLRAGLSTDTLVDSLHELDGPFAIAVADIRHTDSIYLARNNNPVSFSRNLDKGYLAFASTSDILKNSLGDHIETFSMPSDTACRVNASSVTGKLTYRSLYYPSPRINEVRKSIPSWIRAGLYDNTPQAGDSVKCPKCGQYQLYAYTSAGGGISVHECEIV